MPGRSGRRTTRCGRPAAARAALSDAIIRLCRKPITVSYSASGARRSRATRIGQRNVCAAARPGSMGQRSRRCIYDRMAPFAALMGPLAELVFGRQRPAKDRQVAGQKLGDRGRQVHTIAELRPPEAAPEPRPRANCWRAKHPHATPRARPPACSFPTCSRQLCSPLACLDRLRRCAVTSTGDEAPSCFATRGRCDLASTAA
jgi:hypothetical protein